MISILIPIHNFEVVSFVQSLSSQLVASGEHGEIICLDDASEEAYREKNTLLKSIQRVRYDYSEINLGRSGVRNRLVEMALYEHLIFLDCDGRVVQSDYLEKYRSERDRDVVYGGRTYSETPPTDPELYFHWYCGKHKEEVKAQHRLLQPYKAFMTNNFMIKKSIYLKVGMDEALSGYGHEDTLFAAELRRARVSIHHIDNPIEHIGLETADVFLQKSANAIKNLALLIRREQVSDRIPLVKYHKLLQQLSLQRLFEVMVLGMESLIFKQLKSSKPSLRLFDLWKLALLCRAMR